jgi:hypothetical protein
MTPEFIRKEYTRKQSRSIIESNHNAMVCIVTYNGLIQSKIYLTIKIIFRLNNGTLFHLLEIRGHSSHEIFIFILEVNSNENIRRNIHLNYYCEYL